MASPYIEQAARRAALPISVRLNDRNAWVYVQASEAAASRLADRAKREGRSFVIAGHYPVRDATRAYLDLVATLSVPSVASPPDDEAVSNSSPPRGLTAAPIGAAS